VNVCGACSYACAYLLARVSEFDTKNWPRSTREDELVLVACVFVLSGLRTGEDSEYQLCWLYSCLLHPF